MYDNSENNPSLYHEVKNFSYVYILFLGKHLIEKKITEYVICQQEIF